MKMSALKKVYGSVIGRTSLSVTSLLALGADVLGSIPSLLTSKMPGGM